jgi:hypothetical protein
MGGDENIERILQSAGNLRKWCRAIDADGKPCRFGFAEYEDPESLATAVEVLRDVQVPKKRQDVKAKEKADLEKAEGADTAMADGDKADEEVDMSTLLVSFSFLLSGLRPSDI